MITKKKQPLEIWIARHESLLFFGGGILNEEDLTRENEKFLLRKYDICCIFYIYVQKRRNVRVIVICFKTQSVL